MALILRTKKRLSELHRRHSQIGISFPGQVWLQTHGRHKEEFLPKFASRRPDARPSETDEPHFQKPALRPVDYGTDRAALAPLGLLLRDRQRDTCSRHQCHGNGGEW